MVTLLEAIILLEVVAHLEDLAEEEAEEEAVVEEGVLAPTQEMTRGAKVAGEIGVEVHSAGKIATIIGMKEP